MASSYLYKNGGDNVDVEYVHNSSYRLIGHNGTIPSVIFTGKNYIDIIEDCKEEQKRFENKFAIAKGKHPDALSWLRAELKIENIEKIAKISKSLKKFVKYTQQIDDDFILKQLNNSIDNTKSINIVCDLNQNKDIKEMIDEMNEVTEYFSNITDDDWAFFNYSEEIQKSEMLKQINRADYNQGCEVAIEFFNFWKGFKNKKDGLITIGEDGKSFTINDLNFFKSLENLQENTITLKNGKTFNILDSFFNSRLGNYFETYVATRINKLLGKYGVSGDVVGAPPEGKDKEYATPLGDISLSHKDSIFTFTAKFTGQTRGGDKEKKAVILNKDTGKLESVYGHIPEKDQKVVDGKYGKVNNDILKIALQDYYIGFNSIYKGNNITDPYENQARNNYYDAIYCFVLNAVNWRLDNESGISGGRSGFPTFTIVDDKIFYYADYIELFWKDAIKGSQNTEDFINKYTNINELKWGNTPKDLFEEKIKLLENFNDKYNKEKSNQNNSEEWEKYATKSIRWDKYILPLLGLKHAMLANLNYIENDKIGIGKY